MPGVRVVYLAPCPPDPPHSGGALRVGSLWRAMAGVGEARLLMLGEPPPLDARLRLKRLGARIHPSRHESRLDRLVRCVRAAATGACIPAERYLSPRRIERVLAEVRDFGAEVVVAGDAYLTVFLPRLRAAGLRTVIDTHDAAGLVHERVAAASRNLGVKLAYRVLARNTRAVERRNFPLADEVWCVSEDDAAYYRDVPGVRRVAVVPNVVELPPLPAGAGEDGAVAFVGSFGYWPNEDAALRLIGMAGRLQASGDLRRLALVGKAPTDRMRQAAAGWTAVTVTGAVPAVEPWLAEACAVAIPLAAGSGTKLKVLEAMAHARAVVTTPVGAEGLGITPGVEAEVVPLERFEEALGALLRDPDRRARLARAGRAFVEARYSQAAMDAAVRLRLGGVLGLPTSP